MGLFTLTFLIFSQQNQHFKISGIHHRILECTVQTSVTCCEQCHTLFLKPNLCAGRQMGLLIRSENHCQFHLLLSRVQIKFRLVVYLNPHFVEGAFG